MRDRTDRECRAGRTRLGAWLVIGALALAAARPAEAAPDLWRISDGDSSVVLFGSLHLAGRGIRWKSRVVDEAIFRAQTLWVETERPESADDFDAEVAVAGSDPNRALAARLGAADAGRLDALARRLGIRADRLAGMKPWAAAALLIEASTRSAGLSTNGIEVELLRHGQTVGTPVSGLEKAEAPLRVFASLAEEDGLTLLRRTIADLESGSPQHARLATAWGRADEAAIETIGIGEMRAASEALYRRLIVERNRSWVDKLELLMLGKGDHFVSVGILHLVGPDRLQDMMAARGYRVERIVNDEFR